MTKLFELGPHAGFIWSAYGVVAVVLGGLIGWIVADARRQRRRLDALQAKGVTRRSSRQSPQPEDGNPL